ncbi:hypothetical protein BJY00DRAFT_297244 [Aspergillus carlsbadensis]|nr:hypothetical protein BJY00DRAFT_297244 [Aspergillus carlsbadensis]
MANGRFVYDDDSQPWTPDRWNAPTPGNFGRSPVSSLSPSPHRTLPPRDRLGYLPFDEWEEGEEYDQQPPQYVCYTIKWILRINNKRAGGATVKDLVVAPSEYWDERLKDALEDMLQAKKKKNLRARYESAELTYRLMREARVISSNLSLPRTLNGNPWRNSCANGVIYFASARSLQLRLSLPTEQMMMLFLRLHLGRVTKGAVFQRPENSMLNATLTLLMKKSEQEGLHAGTMFMSRCVVESAHAPWGLTGVG